MLFNVKNPARMYAVIVLVMGTIFSATHISVALADDDEDENRRPMVTNAKWKDECGACHLAYPPRFLPAESWRAIMSGLDKHFGSNAGLDAATAREITAFLEKNASTRRHETLAKPVLRITETRTFKSEHRKITAKTWKNPKIKSPANCEACHSGAEQGDFNEDDVNIPK